MDNRNGFTKDELHDIKQSLDYTKKNFESYSYEDAGFRKGQLEKIDALREKVGKMLAEAKT